MRGSGRGGVGIFSNVSDAGRGEEEGEEEEGGGGGGENEPEELNPLTHHEPPTIELPTPQNIVRVPPINWAQYHIVGASLDRLHQEQRIRPAGGWPEGVDGDGAALGPKEWAGAGMGTAMGRREAVVAAPYDPFVDRIDGVPGGAVGSQRGGRGGDGEIAKRGAAGAGVSAGVGAGSGPGAGGSGAAVEGVSTRRRKSGPGGGGGGGAGGRKG